MLQLSLLRHAKTELGHALLADFDRPLAERGRRDAPRMAAYMHAEAIAPDLVLCSTALRTRQTLELVLEGLVSDARGPRILFDDGLYLAESAALLGRIQRVTPAVGHVMVIGHNPGLHELVLRLVGKGRAADLTRLAEKFPTAALAVITFVEADWRHVAAGQGLLERFAVPAQL